MTAKTWFITGASSCFGRAFAEHAVARGHNLIATARTPSALNDIVARARPRVGHAARRDPDWRRPDCRRRGRHSLRVHRRAYQ
jgi:short-subunit dehydrogenase